MRQELLTGHRRRREFLYERLFFLSLLNAFPSHLSPSLHPLCFCPGSCAVLAHAGPQHQRALLRDLWVLDHTLPQPLFLPVRVHPVHLVLVALASKGKQTENLLIAVCFGPFDEVRAVVKFSIINK